MADASVTETPADVLEEQKEVAGCSCGAKFTTHEAATQHECPFDDDPFRLDGIDDELIADLAAVGIDLTNSRDLAQEQREAAAATLLRHVCRRDQQIAEIERTMKLELDLVRNHYLRLLRVPTLERAGLIRHVELLAELSAMQKGFGKKKSATTPYGSFGIRHAAATVEMRDPAALLEHLKTTDPSKVKVTAVMPLNEAREYLNETELAKTKMEPRWSEVKAATDPNGELPPGVAKVPEAIVPFAKPDAPSWMTSGGAR